MRRPARPANPAQGVVRIDARIPAYVKENVALAATMQGRSQTDFMVAVLNEAAQKVIAEHTIIRLCLEDQKLLASALAQGDAKVPGKRLPRLRKAVNDHANAVESV